MYSNVFHFVNLKLLLYNNNSSFIRRYAKRDNEIRQRAGALSAPFGVCWQIGDTKKKDNKGANWWGDETRGTFCL